MKSFTDKRLVPLMHPHLVSSATIPTGLSIVQEPNEEGNRTSFVSLCSVHNLFEWVRISQSHTRYP